MSENSQSRPTSRRPTKNLSPTASEKSNSTDTPVITSEPFSIISDDQLEQGSLYIIKIKQVSLALFEGSELEPMRWSETRQLPGDFDVYNAFDDYGNPPIHLWSRYLKTTLPANWFCMFEQSRQRQRLWLRHQEQLEQAQQDPDASNTDVSSMLLSPHESSLDPNHLDISAPTSESSSSSTAEEILDTAQTTPHDPLTKHAFLPEPKHAISPKSNAGIIDREQLRRHLAPGQATAFSRQSTLQAIACLPNTSNPAMFDLIHSRPYIHQFPTQPDLRREADQLSMVSDVISKSPSLPLPAKILP